MYGPSAGAARACVSSGCITSLQLMCEKNIHVCRCAGTRAPAIRINFNVNELLKMIPPPHTLSHTHLPRPRAIGLT
jgi:hypothetical protein